MDPRIPRLRRKFAAIPIQPLRSHSFGEEQHGERYSRHHSRSCTAGAP